MTTGRSAPRTGPRNRQRTAAISLACSVGWIAPSTVVGQQPDALKVDVVGSHVPRAPDASALPVQIILREDIERSGVTSAAELLWRLPANMNGRNDQLSIGSLGAPGLASANLRGLGDGKTLVLVNGRRLANYAFLSGTVDLNSIPLAAVERVEILKDGASAIYGTDAIAGVINFVLRKDYRGIEATGQLAQTEHGGADRHQVTLAAGAGDLARDRVNASITIDWQREEALAARDRSFARTSYLPDAGIDQLSPVSFPANVLIGRGVLGNPARDTGCLPPLSLPTSDGACGFDFASVSDIIPRTERLSVVARAALQPARGHELFAEYIYSRSELALRVSPSPVVPVFYPESGPYYPSSFARTNGIAGDLFLLYRTVALGARRDDVRTDAQRVIIGARGAVWDWDYNLALNHSETRSTDRFVSGFVSRSAIGEAFATGLINPFGASTPEGNALLAASQVFGEFRRAKGTTDEVDVRISSELLNLPGGPLAMAFGLEARRERLVDAPSPVLAGGDLAGNQFALDGQDASRDVKAAFLELNVPVWRGLEAQLSARHDRYDDFGSTTNPKVSLRWQPVRSVLVRGSWGRGFHAPSLPDLYLPQAGFVQPDNGGRYADPVRCPVTGSAEDCRNTSYEVRAGGNPGLQPERSTQASAGIVWEVARALSIGIDYWHTEVTDVIASLSSELIFEHFDTYGSTNVLRGPRDPANPGIPGPITTLIEWNQNVGNVDAEGYDVEAHWRSATPRWGQWEVRLEGTYITRWTEHLRGVAPESAVGRFGSFDPIPRWRHQLQMGWQRGSWIATVAQHLQSGYVDQNPDAAGQPRRVGVSEVWDAQISYVGLSRTRLAVGVRNLFDRAPPFSNQSTTFQVGYDPISGDPRGRTFYGRLSYAFR